MRRKSVQELIPAIQEAIKSMPVSFNHQVTHVVAPPTMERKLDSIVITVINNLGERWIMTPMLVTAERAMVNGFPYSFVSGRKEDDNSVQCHMEMELHYRDVPVQQARLVADELNRLADSADEYAEAETL